MEILEINNIYMNYHTPEKETNALININFSLKKGEFVTIVGPSGCGKSTLLNLIAGLNKPSSGEIIFNNKNNTPFKNADNNMNNRIGYMFQTDQLFEWTSVYNNITLGLRIQHKLTKENESFVDSLLKNYGLWDFKSQLPSQLSGGMRQRIALIRTLALKPEILLLDEPFSALDYQSRLNASNDIYKIIRKENKTALMVTHDIAEATSMSDRVIILSKRPAYVKDILSLYYENKYNSPLKRRESPNFKDYFNTIWKELDKIDELE
ncbi:ABC transporter ATP-binding protein [Clostridium sp. DL1XJH146]